MRGRLGVTNKPRLVVSTHQGDETLEAVWANRYEFVQALADAGYDLVLSPSYSTWDHLPRLEHRYQIARSLRMYEMLVDAGIPSIPNVGWYLRRDIADWATALMAEPNLWAFSVDLQTLQSDEKWDWGLRGLKHLAERIGPGWEVVVNGVGRSDRIQELKAVFGHVHVINARAFELAMSDRITRDELLTGELQTAPGQRMDNFSWNVRSWADHTGVPAPCRFAPEPVRR